MFLPSILGFYCGWKCFNGWNEGWGKIARCMTSWSEAFCEQGFCGRDQQQRLARIYKALVLHNWRWIIPVYQWISPQQAIQDKHTFFFLISKLVCVLHQLCLIYSWCNRLYSRSTISHCVHYISQAVTMCRCVCLWRVSRVIHEKWTGGHRQM